MKKKSLLLLTSILTFGCSGIYNHQEEIKWPENFDQLEQVEKTIGDISSNPAIWDSLIKENTKPSNSEFPLNRSEKHVNPSANNPFLQNDGKFLHISHRGGGVAAPEETRISWAKSISQGADTLEGDIHITKDGYLVMSHDADLSNCTNSDKEIKNMTLEEIRSVDAAYKFTMDGGKTYPYRGKGIQIPLFREALIFLKYETLPGGEPILDSKGEMIPRDKPIPMILEIKPNDPALVEPVWNMIGEYDLWNTLVLCSSKQDTQDEIRKRIVQHQKSTMTVLTIREALVFTAIPAWYLKKKNYDPPALMFAAPYAVVNKLSIKKGLEFGIRINAWTVNNETIMRFLIDQGCNAIQTDNSALLTEVLKEYDL